MFVKVSKNHYMDTSRVVAILPPHTRPAIDLRDTAKKSGRVINLKGGTVKIKSMCILDTGQVVLIPLTPDLLVKRTNLAHGLLPESKARRGERFYEPAEVIEPEIDLLFEAPVSTT